MLPNMLKKIVSLFNSCRKKIVYGQQELADTINFTLHQDLEENYDYLKATIL